MATDAQQLKSWGFQYTEEGCGRRIALGYISRRGYSCDSDFVADEAVSSVVKSLHSHSEIESYAHFRNAANKWIPARVKSVLRRELREHHGSLPTDASAIRSWHDPASEAAAKEEHELQASRRARALSRLCKEDQDLLHRKDVLEQTYREIGEAYGKDTSWAYKRVLEARRRLRKAESAGDHATGRPD